MLRFMGILDDLKPTQKKLKPMEIGVAGRELAITWDDGWRTLTPLKLLRENCPCAGCVDEWSGKRMLDPASIRDDIRPLRMEPMGNYALQVTWSDGHSSGIYSWELLRRLVQQKPDAA